MSAPSMATPTGMRPMVSAQARELAARLSALFHTDCRIAARLNDAQRRLADANDRLWSGLHPDAFGHIYDGAIPAGHSQIAKLIQAGPASQTAVLGVLQQTHWAIHRAFCDYQSACEERRQLAVDVGELSVQLTEELCAAGFSPKEARQANVHELAGTIGSGEMGR